MAETIVKLEHVAKRYGKCTALKDCALKLERGRIYGLVGKNGAGKTTMMRLIAGLDMPDDGRVTLFSQKPAGMLIEAPGLIENMTAAENLKFFGMLSKTVKTKTERTEKTEAFGAEEVLSLVGLENDRHKKVKDYSLGMRQRLGIAVAILGKPEFVMLDEPINGLDPIGVVEIRKLIKRLCEEFGMTVFISSHNLPELYQTANDFLFIDGGVIKKEITQKQLEAEDHESLETYFLSVIQAVDGRQ